MGNQRKFENSPSERMKQPIKSLAIGIPAFNEEYFLPELLKAVMSQKISSAVLQEVIVLSDASTDETDRIVRQLRKTDARISLLRSDTRIGKGLMLNAFFTKTAADIAVVLDADITLQDNNTIEQLIQPIAVNTVDLTSAIVQPLSSKNWIQKVLAASMKLKEQVFLDWNNGDNIYTCHGRARAFSKRFYQKVRFIDSIGEDAYSYLVCKKLNMKYQLATNAQVFFELPKTFKDHAKQSIRFSHSQVSYVDQFDPDFIQAQYSLPKNLFFAKLLESLKTQPLEIISYAMVMVAVKIVQPFMTTPRHTWQIATTSKH